VSQQHIVITTQCIGDGKNVVDIINMVITNAGRTMIGQSMPGQVNGDNTARGKRRTDPTETGGIVQPPMKGEHDRAIDRPPRLAAEKTPR
jgi:hypothetical protein